MQVANLVMLENTVLMKMQLRSLDLVRRDISAVADHNQQHQALVKIQGLAQKVISVSRVPENQKSVLKGHTLM